MNGLGGDYGGGSYSPVLSGTGSMLDHTYGQGADVFSGSGLGHAGMYSGGMMGGDLLGGFNNGLAMSLGGMGAHPQHLQQQQQQQREQLQQREQQQYQQQQMGQQGLPPASAFGASQVGGGALGDFGGSGVGGGIERALPPALAGKLKQRGHIYEFNGKRLEIRDVWKDNLESEMKLIRQLVQRYPYVAMDTEFPGVVARPVGSFSNSVDFQYQTLRCNVDLLKLIQLGVALADDEGNFPDEVPCWQFHFRFSLADDMYAQDSIDLLQRSGIDFELHETMGVDVLDFGEALMSSGLVLMDEVRWISFHGGYDFGYLLKLLTFAPLPAEEADFFKILHTYFPCVYDVKHIMTKLEGATFKAGLNKLAEELGARRIGPMHQAGSDSLLTASVFFALRRRYFNNKMKDEGHAGVLHGIGEGDPVRLVK
jgi:CCR4-NOT transcription complex subunit 7/8